MSTNDRPISQVGVPGTVSPMSHEFREENPKYNTRLGGHKRLYMQQIGHSIIRQLVLSQHSKTSFKGMTLANTQTLANVVQTAGEYFRSV